MDERAYDHIDRYRVICRPGYYTFTKAEDGDRFLTLYDVEYPNGSRRLASEVGPLRLRG